MLKGQVLDDYSKMSINNLLARARRVHSSMKGNKNFVKPNPTLERLLTAINNLDDTMQLGGAATSADRKAQRAVLIAVLKGLQAYVNYTAGGDRVMLASSGFTVNAEIRATGKEPGKPEAPIVTQGKNSGEIQVAIKVSDADSFLYQVATTPVTGNWTSEPSKAKKYVFKGLARGTEYAIRFGALGRSGNPVYSVIVYFIAN